EGHAGGGVGDGGVAFAQEDHGAQCGHLGAVPGRLRGGARVAGGQRDPPSTTLRDSLPSSAWRLFGLL
ncbi:hypothetical protein C0992_002673, partial [Termitomyces sp. T32_za158]